MNGLKRRTSSLAIAILGLLGCPTTDGLPQKSVLEVDDAYKTVRFADLFARRTTVVRADVLRLDDHSDKSRSGVPVTEVVLGYRKVLCSAGGHVLGAENLLGAGRRAYTGSSELYYVGGREGKVFRKSEDGFLAPNSSVLLAFKEEAYGDTGIRSSIAFEESEVAGRRVATLTRNGKGVIGVTDAGFILTQSPVVAPPHLRPPVAASTPLVAAPADAEELWTTSQLSAEIERRCPYLGPQVNLPSTSSNPDVASGPSSAPAPVPSPPAQGSTLPTALRGALELARYNANVRLKFEGLSGLLTVPGSSTPRGIFGCIGPFKPPLSSPPLQDL